MVLDLTRLADQQLITTTSAVNLVTNPSGKKTVILSVYAQNTSTTEFVIVSLYRVPDNSGLVGSLNETTHLIPYPISLAPRTGNEWEGKIILSDLNDSFWIKVSIANVLTVSIDGLQG